MTLKLEASVNILWQNLIALNASLVSENEERRMQLLDTKQLLNTEIEKSKALQAKIEIQQHELSTNGQLIARLSSKLKAVRQIVEFDQQEDHNVTIDSSTSTVPIIVKVESVESNATDVRSEYGDTLLPVNVCNECDKKFSSIRGLKRHMPLHSDPSISCPKCPLKFVRLDYMQRHMKRAHVDGLSRICRMKTTLKKFC